MAEPRPSIGNLLPADYVNLLDGLEQALGVKVYLYGGWVLSALLSKPYFGDIDIVTELPLSDLSDALASLGVKTGTRLNDILRIRLADGNFIDANSLYFRRKKLSLKAFLSRKTFSVNACAIDIGTGKYTFTEQCERDILERNFRVNPNAEMEGQRPLSVLRTWHEMKCHYGLEFVATNGFEEQYFETLDKNWPTNQIGTGSTEQCLKSTLEPFLPKQFDKYLTKGAVRSIILNSFTVWDDVDVIVKCDRREIVRHLQSFNAEFSLNHYGNPKISLPVGQFVDVIPIGKNGNLAETLESFFHESDRLIWDWQTEHIEDPVSVRDNLSKKVITFPKPLFLSLAEEDIAYFALKSVYLIVRHDFEHDSQTMRHINSPQAFTPHHRRLCVSMVKELICTQPKALLKNRIYRLDAGIRSSATSLFLSYLQ
ncbi:hypothetical protein [Hyphobacterium indicum]|uniref:hypothetical protein n=1 Tax=Hyphobacterium indicum TaxID=2162714 RepID=UPI000D645A6F|nr:hypothetical protein [Hyphobacterium indicum]